MIDGAIDLGYFPQCVVNLTLRFDEAIQVYTSAGNLLAAQLTGELGLRPGEQAGKRFVTRTRRVTDRDRARRLASSLQGSGTNLGLVADSVREWGADGTRVTQTKRAVVTETPAYEALFGKDGRSIHPLTYGGDGFTTIMDRVPKRGSFTLPHPRQAETFSLVFDYADLPVDARLLRAVGVEIHLGCVDPSDYAAGMAGAVDGAGRSRSLLRTRGDLIDPWTGKPVPADQTLVFYGTADRWFTEHDDATGSWVTVEGRGVRGILLDGTPPTNVLEDIDLTRPVDRVCADLIATIPIDERLALDVATDESEWPSGKVPSPGDVKGFTRVRLGTTGQAPQAASATGASSSGGGGGSGSGKISYWDLLTNICNLVGAIPYIRGQTLWIRPARSIFALLTDPTIETPFASEREAPDGRLAIRRMVYGGDHANIKKLTYDRKFNSKTVPIVRAYGFDDTAKGMARFVSAQWPPADSAAAKAKKKKKVSTGNGESSLVDVDILRISVPEVKDPKRLVEIARDVYEEIGRGEMGGSVETKKLASFGGDNADPDLLRLRPTDAIEIVVDVTNPTTPTATELVDHNSMSFEEEVDAIYQRMGDMDVARAIVTARRGAAIGLLDQFRVSQVQYEWDTSSGIAISFDFQNYVVARHAAGASADASPAQPTKTRRVRRHRVEVDGENTKREVAAQPTTTSDTERVPGEPEPRRAGETWSSYRRRAIADNIGNKF